MLRLLQRLGRQGKGLPALAVVATLLYVADGRAEKGRAVLLRHREERELRVEVDKLLDDDLVDVAARSLHGVLVGLLELVVVVDVALSVTTRRHQRLHHTRESDLVGSLLKLVERLGIEVFGRPQSQFLGSEVADGAAVHREVDCLGRGDDLYALLLHLEEALGTDGFDLGHDDVGAVAGHDRCQGVSVQHAEDLALVSHLHGGCIVVTVASDDVLAGTLGSDGKFLAQFT